MQLRRDTRCDWLAAMSARPTAMSASPAVRSIGATLESGTTSGAAANSVHVYRRASRAHPTANGARHFRRARHVPHNETASPTSRHKCRRGCDGRDPRAWAYGKIGELHDFRPRRVALSERVPVVGRRERDERVARAERAGCPRCRGRCASNRASSHVCCRSGVNRDRPGAPHRRRLLSVDSTQRLGRVRSAHSSFTRRRRRPDDPT